MEGVLLREAKEEDVPALMAVIHAAFEEYRGRLDPPSGAHTETLETLRQKMHTSRAALAMINQEIIGCVFYQPTSDHVYLGRLAVLPPYRRQRVGRKLIAWVETQTRSLGHTRVRLGVRIALSDNQAYFEHLGYRVLNYGSHVGYIEPTYVNLEKDISRGNG